MPGNTSAEHKKVSNPLTLMAIFAGLSESISVGVLPLLSNNAVQEKFVWFVMLFPTLLLIAFFFTLNFNHTVLYAPSDFPNPGDFVTVAGKYAPVTEPARKLMDFWKPGGTINPENAARLRRWIQENGIQPPSITFLANSASHAAEREKAVEDLGL